MTAAASAHPEDVDDSVSAKECPVETDPGEEAPDHPSRLATLVQLPPALARVAAVSLGGALFVGLAWSSPALRTGLTALGASHPLHVVAPPAAFAILASLLLRLALPSRWSGPAVDGLLLRVPGWAGFWLLVVAGVCAITQPGALFGPLLPLAAALSGILGFVLCVPSLWRRRAERAWLLGRPAYRSSLVATFVVGAAVPALAALALGRTASELRRHLDPLLDMLATRDQDCPARLAAVMPGSRLDRLVLAAFGPWEPGLGENLADCLAGDAAVRPTLASRVLARGGHVCDLATGPGPNRDAVAGWHVERDTIAGSGWMRGLLDPEAREAYDRRLRGHAAASGACDDPFLVPEALLLAAADAGGVLGDCGRRFTDMSRAEWARQGLAAVGHLGAEAAFRAQVPPSGRRYTEVSRLLPVTNGEPASVAVAEAVLLRPLEGPAMDVALHVRWVPGARVPRTHPDLSPTGNEVHVAECGTGIDAAAFPDLLRDHWHFAERRLMGSAACPPSPGLPIRHVYALGGGHAFVVAERSSSLGSASLQTRLVFTESDPCRD